MHVSKSDQIGRIEVTVFIQSLRSSIIFGQVSKLGNHGFGVEVRLFLGDLIQLGLGHGAKAELRPSVPFSEGLSGLVSK